MGLRPRVCRRGPGCAFMRASAAVGGRSGAPWLPHLVHARMDPPLSTSPEPTTGSRRSDLRLMGGRGEQVAHSVLRAVTMARAMNTKKNQSRLATIKHSRAMRPVIPVVRLVRRASRRGPKRARRELTRVRTKAQNVWWPRLRGRPTIPPPHAYKESVVLAYASRFGPRLFIETGTLHGDMVEATRDAFEHVWSIELDEAFWGRRGRAVSRAIPRSPSSTATAPRLCRRSCELRRNPSCTGWMDTGRAASRPAEAWIRPCWRNSPPSWRAAMPTT